MTRLDIQMKYLALAREGLNKLRERFHQSLQSASSKKEEYKLVEKHNERMDRFLDKLNKAGLAEIAKLPADTSS